MITGCSNLKNKEGLTITERIKRDIEFAEMSTDSKQRELLSYMVIAAAELAVDFELITYQEWGELTRQAFSII